MGLDVFGVCEQQWRRQTCASAQTDQRLCYSLFGKYNIWTCYETIFNFYLVSAAEEAGLSFPLLETLKMGFAG